MPTRRPSAWLAALESRTRPTVLVLSRQDLPVIDRAECSPATGLARGAYVLWESGAGSVPEVILIGTGSEVHLCLEAGRRLAVGGRRVRVVSMPSWDLFEAQPASYRDAVMPPGVRARLAVEAGVSMGWERYVGPGGGVIAVDRFGASAPGQVLAKEYGFTVERVAEVALSLCGSVTVAREAGKNRAVARPRKGRGAGTMRRIAGLSVAAWTVLASAARRARSWSSRDPTPSAPS